MRSFSFFVTLTSVALSAAAWAAPSDVSSTTECPVNASFLTVSIDSSNPTTTIPALFQQKTNVTPEQLSYSCSPCGSTGLKECTVSAMVSTNTQAACLELVSEGLAYIDGTNAYCEAN